MAKKLNFILLDEIFDLHVNPTHKQTIHESHLKNIYPKNPKFLYTVDLEKSVVNNHLINYFSLEKTNIFLSRKNVQDSFWSLLSYLEKYINFFHPELSNQQLMESIGRYLQEEMQRAEFFYEYCHVFKKEITVPDLQFRDSKIYREKFKIYKDKIENFKSKLILPYNLIYE
jgi:hypothetical protein